jgi:hypothetical protein
MPAALKRYWDYDSFARCRIIQSLLAGNDAAVVMAVYAFCRMIQCMALCCSLTYSGFQRSLSMWPGDM